jgi:hypothetical protein
VLQNYRDKKRNIGLNSRDKRMLKRKKKGSRLSKLKRKKIKRKLIDWLRLSKKELRMKKPKPKKELRKVNV